MYKWQTVVDKIRAVARKKRISILTALEAAGSDPNADTKVIENGMYSFNPARIADCLGCSVDYLLGRSEIPNSYLCVDSKDIADANLLELIRKYK